MRDAVRRPTVWCGRRLRMPFPGLSPEAMRTGAGRWALPAVATVFVAAAIVVAILVSSGGGGGSQTSGQGTGTAGGAATGRTTALARGGDPSAAYEAAARTALPS